MQLEPEKGLQILRQLTLELAKAFIKSEEELREKKEAERSEYETLLQKLEGEVRQHIRVKKFMGEGILMANR